MKYTMTIILLSGLFFVGTAQERPRSAARPNPEERLERATKELELTNSQVKLWKEIHEKYKPEVDATREKHESVREKIETELLATLTPDQKVKFNEMKKNRPKGRKP